MADSLLVRSCVEGGAVVVVRVSVSDSSSVSVSVSSDELDVSSSSSSSSSFFLGSSRAGVCATWGGGGAARLPRKQILQTKISYYLIYWEFKNFLTSQVAILYIDEKNIFCFLLII